MALAKLTVDLVLGLQQFEGDSGKAAQIATRDSERMTRAARAVQAALEKQADQVGRTTGEFLALQAAQAGLGRSSQELAAYIDKMGQASVTNGAAATGSAKQASAAAVELAATQRKLEADLLAGMNQVNDAYNARRAAIIAAQQAGTITSDQYKQQLAELSALREESLRQLKTERDRELIAAKAAAAESQAQEEALALTEKRRVATERLIATVQKLNYDKAVAQDAADIAKLRATVEAENAAEVKAAEQAVQAQDQRRAATERLIATVQKLNYQRDYQQDAADIAKLRAAIEAETAADEKAVASGQRFIQSLRERIAAIGQTREAQQHLEATRLGVQDEARPLIYAQGQQEFLAGIEAEIARVRKLSAEFGLTKTKVLELQAAQLHVFNEDTTKLISELKLAQDAYDRVAQAAQRAAAAKAKDEAFIEKIKAEIAAEERFAATFGKTAIEIHAMDAAAQGLSGQVTPLLAKLVALQAANAKLRGSGAAAPATDSDRFLAKLVREREEIGKQKEELYALEAARLQIDKAVSGPAIKAIGDEQFAADLRSRIAEQQRLAAEFGKSDVEILKMNASARQLDQTLAADIALYERLKTANAALGIGTTNPKAPARNEAQEFIDGLVRERVEAGKTRDELDRLKGARLGLSTVQVDQHIQGRNDAEFIAGLQKQVAEQRKLNEEFGKSTVEIAKMQAAKRGLTAQTHTEIEELDRLKTANAAAQTKLDNDAYLAKVSREIDAMGKLRSEILALDLAQRGLSAEGAGLVARMQEAEKNMGKYGIAGHGAAAATKITAFEMQQLSYTVSDVVASLASGISPMTILLQQGGQVRDVFGGFGNVLSKVGQLFTPFRVGVGAAVAAIAAWGYAALKGSEESKKFAQAQTQSGNAAGQTEGMFRAAAARAADRTTATIGQARELALELAKSGAITQFAYSTGVEAAARYAEATGKTAQEVGQDFAQMAKDPLRWAQETGKAMGIVDGDQVEAIRKLQVQKREWEAQGIVFDAINEHYRRQHDNLRGLDTVLNTVAKSFSRMWGSMKEGAGAATTAEDALEKAQRRLKEFQDKQPQSKEDAERERHFRGTRVPPGSFNEQQLKDDVAAATRRVLRESEAASAEASRTQDKKDAVAAVEFQERMRANVKAAQNLKEQLARTRLEMEQYNEAAAKEGARAKAEGREPTFLPLTPAQMQRQEFATGAANIDPWIAAGAQAKATRNLSLIDQELTREKDRFAEQNAQLDALYNDGRVSLQSYFAKRRELIQAEGDAEAKALLKQANEKEAERKATPYLTPAENQNRLTEIADLREKAAQKAVTTGYAIKKAVTDETIARRQLADTIAELDAQAKQLAGDELGAAQIRTAQAIETARRTATAALKDIKPVSPNFVGPPARDADEVDKVVQALERAKKEGDAFADVQRKVSYATADAARAEELYLLQATQGGATLEEQESGIYQIRVLALRQLGELTEKAQALAAASTNPEIKRYAEDLALTYQKAALAVDPALNRIRDAVLQTASDVSSGLASSLADFGSLQRARMQQAAQDTADQRNEYTRQIDDLRSSLRNISDEKQRAAVRDRIKDLEAKRAAVKDQGTFLKTLERDVIGPALKKVYNVGIKLFVEDPLETFLKAQIQKALANVSTKDLVIDPKGVGTDSVGHGYSQAKDSAAADRGTTGQAEEAAIKAAADPLVTAAATQTAALNESALALKDNTAAVNTLTDAVNRASGSGGAQQGGAASPSAAGIGPDAIGHGYSQAKDSAAADVSQGIGLDSVGKGYSQAKDSAMAEAVNKKLEAAANSSAELGKTMAATKTATEDVNAVLPQAGQLLSLLGGSAGQAGQALSLLPRIISFIEAASTSSSGSGGIWSLIMGAIDTYTSGYSISRGGTDYRGTTLPDSLRGGAATGTNLLERDLLTIVHKGEAVVPKEYNPAAPGGMAWFTQQLQQAKPTTVNLNWRDPAPVRQDARSRSGSGERGGNVYVTNNAPAEVKTAERDRNGDWHLLIEAAAEQAHSRVAADVRSGSGRVASSMKARGLNLDANNPRRM